MPTVAATTRRPLSMAAIAVDHHHHNPFKPVTLRNRRHRLLSFPHPDLDLLHLLGPSTTLCSPRPQADPSPFHRSLSTPCLSSSVKPDAGVPHTTRVEILLGRKSPAVHALVVEAAIAMATGILPVPAPAGLGGAYYLHNRAGRSLAVLKPAVDEPLGLALGRPIGEAAVREVAAYLLDHGGFSGVPPTALVRVARAALRQRVASIQRFVPHSFDAGDFGPSRFSVASVHRIGILDVRLLNVDRHSGNILVRSFTDCGGGGQAAAELVPIDHGLCLPELLEDPYFEWLHWPQAMVPFSEAEAEYIAALDPRKDAELLRAELPVVREPSIRVLVLCTTFLKRAVAAGLCLSDIGDMMTRGFCGGGGAPASALEAICRRVERSMRGGDDDEYGVPASDAQVKEGFQLGMECVEMKEEVVVDVPVELRRPSVEVKGLYRLEEEEGVCGGGGEAGRSLVRSASFGGSSERGRQRGSGRGMSFKGMGEEEWGEFMVRFEEAVEESLDLRRGMGLGLGLVRKDRLGRSCRF